MRLPLTILVCLALFACGDRNTGVIPDSNGTGDGNGSNCLQFGFECGAAGSPDCCSGLCVIPEGGTTAVCSSPGDVCQPEGGPCASALDCCGLACTAGGLCAADGATCTS